jgi:hypothetical protein
MRSAATIIITIMGHLASGRPCGFHSAPKLALPPLRWLPRLIERGR